MHRLTTSASRSLAQHQTGTRPHKLPRQITRIVAAAPFSTASTAEILTFIGRQKRALVVLPGRAVNMPSPGDVMKRCCNGIAVFVEEDDGEEYPLPCIVDASRITHLPRQLFHKSNPTARQMDDLAKALPGRTVTMGGRPLTFILCGEINGFRTDGTPKHGQKFNHGIVINLAHTMMKHWNYLGPKLAALSKNSIAVHVANNGPSHDEVITDVRIYRNGTEVTRRIPEGRIAWCECHVRNPA